MKMDRLATIDRIDQMLADAEAVFIESEAKKLADWEASLERWRVETAPALLIELRRVVETVRKGRYPDTDLMDRRSYTKHEAIWGSLSGKPEPKTYQPSQKLLRLRAILADCTADEYVTTAQIKELGFSPATFIAS